MDFSQLRFNMVEQQIRPWEVLNFQLLDVLAEIPRELFVCEEYLSLAYADMSLPLVNGGKMLEPKIVARLIQALKLTKENNVLEIATGSGYATAILASLAKNVTTIDIDKQQSQFAQAALAKLNINNVSFQIKDGLTEELGIEQYDAIYIGGGIRTLPEAIKTAVKDGGCIVAVIGKDPVMKATLKSKFGDTWTNAELFETSIPQLTQQDIFTSFDF